MAAPAHVVAKALVLNEQSTDSEKSFESEVRVDLQEQASPDVLALCA